MSGYETVIKKNTRPHLESLRDDLNARKDKSFFWPNGTQVYCGRQGSGKTISAVKHTLDLKKRYPKAIIVSNIDLKYYERKTFDNLNELQFHLRQFECEKEFISKFHQAIFCSQKCATLSVRKFEISKEELEELVWSMSTVKVAKLLGVSDVAIAKRCKLLGVEKPPRGYWAKVQYNKLENIFPIIKYV